MQNPNKKQNNKNKKRLTVLCSCLVGVMAIGGVMAYFTDADTVTNKFTVGKVSLDLTEPNWNPENDDKDGDGLKDAYTIMPGFEVEKDPQITNTGVNDEFVFMTVTVPYYNVVTATENGEVEENAKGIQVGYSQPLFQFGGKGKPISVAGTVLYTTLEASEMSSLKTAQGSHTQAQTLLNADESSKVIAAVINNGWTYMAGDFNLPDSANTENYTSDTDTFTNGDGDGLANYVITETITNPEEGNEATSLAGGGKGTGVSAQTKNGITFPVIDQKNHQITYLFAYTGDTGESTASDYIKGESSGITLKRLKAGETTPTLFDYVKLINIVEDQKNITDLEKTAQSVIINAYGIQTTNVRDDDTVAEHDNMDGSLDPVTVWNALAKQSPDTMMAADVTEEDVNYEKETDQTPDLNSDNEALNDEAVEIDSYKKTDTKPTNDGPNINGGKTH